MTNTSKLQECKRIWVIKYVSATVMMPIVIELESRMVIVSHEKKEGNTEIKGEYSNHGEVFVMQYPYPEVYPL